MSCSGDQFRRITFFLFCASKEINNIKNFSHHSQENYNIVDTRIFNVCTRRNFYYLRYYTKVSFSVISAPNLELSQLFPSDCKNYNKNCFSVYLIRLRTNKIMLQISELGMFSRIIAFSLPFTKRFNFLIAG